MRLLNGTGFLPRPFKIALFHSVNFITHHYSNTTFLQSTWSNVVCKSRPCSSSPGSITFFKHVSYNTSALVSSSNQISLLWIILCKPLIRNIILLLPAVQRSFRLSCTYAHILYRHDLFPISRYIFWKCKPLVFCNRKKINSI